MSFRGAFNCLDISLHAELLVVVCPLPVVAENQQHALGLYHLLHVVCHGHGICPARDAADRAPVFAQFLLPLKLGFISVGFVAVHGLLNINPSWSCMALARKSIKQRFQPSVELLSVMESFRQMTNDCIRIGMKFESENNNRTPSMKKLSLLAYAELRKRYGGYSQYSLCAIAKAAGIISARRKSIRRAFHTKTPYLSRPGLVCCYGFRIDGSNLIIRLDAEITESIPLNTHTRAALSDTALKVRSFTLTKDSLSLCIAREISKVDHNEFKGAVGVDRNLRN